MLDRAPQAIPAGKVLKHELRDRYSGDPLNEPARRNWTDRPNEREGRPQVGLLDGKTMVVSGVGPGLGREIAEAAGARGRQRRARRAHRGEPPAAADGIDPKGERVAWQVTDVTNGEDCDSPDRRSAVDRFGGVDSLVNCAAFDTLFGGLEDTDWDGWRTTYDVNVFGTLRMTRGGHRATSRHAEAGRSCSSGRSRRTGRRSCRWRTRRRRARSITAMYYLAKELGPSKIRVNTVMPSWMWGPPVEGYVNMIAEPPRAMPAAEEVKAGIANQMMLHEIPADGDIAESVVFLASDRARMITGQALMVNAGDFVR